VGVCSILENSIKRIERKKLTLCIGTLNERDQDSGLDVERLEEEKKKNNIW